MSRSPRVVTRGESLSPLSVLIDFLNFSVPGGDEKKIIRRLSGFLGVQPEDRGRGLHGYTRSFDFQGYAIVAYGGERQRGTVYVSINGAGCARIKNWEALRHWAQGMNAVIRRCDVAADDLAGRYFTVADGVAAYKRGDFQLTGRPPKAKLIDDLGNKTGRTLYVGERSAGKSFKLYEKGKQLGDANSKWARVEVEFYGKDRVVPWEILTNPAPFLAGSYPFLHALAMVRCKIATMKKAAEVSIEKAKSWLREVGGRTINLLLANNGGDMVGLVMELRRGGVPARFRTWFEPTGEAVACGT